MKRRQRLLTVCLLYLFWTGFNNRKTIVETYRNSFNKAMISAMLNHDLYNYHKNLHDGK